MKWQEDIEKLLERLGDEWPEDGSIVESVMRQIESAPVPPSRPNRWRIVMKCFLGIAACVAVFAGLWWGSVGNQVSLYAQVINAVRQARALHTRQYVQPQEGAQPRKVMESWFERGVGFREEGLGYVRLGNDEYLWTFAEDRKVATRSRSNGIATATEPIFAEIDRLARQLQDEFERFPSGDQTLDGQRCKAYLLTKPDRHVDSQLKSGLRRSLVFLDQQSRLVRAVVQRHKDNRWNTESFVSYQFDEPVDRALFQPDFGKDTRVVEADQAVEEFVSLESAVHIEQRAGLIYAVHRVERFENGGVLVVSSVRGAEETLKKYPLTRRRVRPGEFLVDGPARHGRGSPQGPGYFRLELAWASHQGVDLSWWAMIPRGTRPNHFEVAPDRIKLNVGITPQGRLADSLRDQVGLLTWDLEVHVPQTSAIATLEEITRRVYADQLGLEPVTFKALYVGDYREQREVNVDEITAGEYAKAVANNFHSWMEADVEDQLERQFDPITQKAIASFMDGRIAIGLSYQALVDDAILERVAKRKLLTHLYLRGTRITDEGLKHLSGLTQLQTLDLAETGITDRGLRHLRGLSRLKHLDVTQTAVTADGVAILQRAISNVDVRRKANDNP